MIGRLGHYSKGAHIKSQIEGEWPSGLNVPQAQFRAKGVKGLRIGWLKQ